MNLHFLYQALLVKYSGQVSQRLLKLSIVTVLLMAAIIANAQVPIDRPVQCFCLDNGAPSGNAQFQEQIRVTSSPGETWYIISSSGFYKTSSPVPPAQQIPFQIGPTGDTLVYSALNSYTLDGILLEDVGYSISVTNGIDTSLLSNILCIYPSADIFGDNAICEGEIVTYSAVPEISGYTYSWYITGEGLIIGPTNTASLTVDWNNNAVGTSQIYLTVEGPTGCGSGSNLDIVFEEDLTLACNNGINHSVSTNCIIDITPSDVLQDMKYNDDSYVLTLYNPETNEEIPNGTLASDILFDTLQYSVQHICSGNSCWGTIIFEDKYVPPLTCINDTLLCHLDDAPIFTGFPVPNTATVISLGNNNYRVENFDPCGDANLSFTDTEQFFGCSEDFSSIVTRKWVITDFSGYTGQCTQLIYKTRTTLVDVIFPGDWDGISNPVLQCDGNFPTLPNGYPDPIFTGSPSGGVCDHISISYTDLPTFICGATYKIIRKWKAIDECANTSILYNQLIKIEDNDAPVFNCPSAKNFLIENTSSCATTVSFPIPTNFTDCSLVTFTATIVKISSNGSIAGTITAMNKSGANFTSSNRELGKHRVVITAVDECGFKSECSTIATVLDGVPPTAVCDQKSTISLDNTGYAEVHYTSFDNGSFDNCSVQKIEVSRGLNTCGAPSGFGESIILCCDDVNKEITITLKVTDNAGNVNTCQVFVYVQDKKAPTIYCPPSQTITCYSDYEDLTKFGQATAEDNCMVSIANTVDYQVNSCGLGSIYRQFTATDIAGNTTICTQVLTLINDNPFVLFDIDWPDDYTITDCVSPEILPEDLPLINGFPNYNLKSCTNIIEDYDDKVFTNVNGSCKTIFRTWTVKETCSNKTFPYTQKLYIVDNQKPEFTECSNKVLTGIPNDDCEYAISYSKSATDQCTAEEDIFINYIIDLYNNGGADITGNGNTINKDLPVGIHKISWYAKDDCNNQATCTEIITIEDDKFPTPYCIGGISTVIMPSTGFISIWAKDFNLSSSDNCTEAIDLVYSFSPVKGDISTTIYCEDLEGLDEKIFTFKIYVHDQAGNYDFCTSSLRITANSACDTVITTTISVDGLVFTSNNEMMKDVNMQINESIQDLNYGSSTDELGNYAFHDLPMMMEYKIIPSYSEEAINGITTLDIILIQKHILGIQLLDSPYKVIAADINNSSSVSGIDIIQLRKLILGFYDEFPNSPTWRFVDANQTFNDIYSPWPFNEQITFLADKNYTDKNFISIKVGDVNLSKKFSFNEDNEATTRSNETIEITYEIIENNGYYSANFEVAEEINLVGVQFGIESEMLSDYISITSGELELSEDMINLEDQSLILSWSQATAKRISKNLFTINFGSTNPSQIILNQFIMKAEAYLESSDGFNIVNIDLRQKQSVSIDPIFKEQLKVYQNTPNPFDNYTQIEFDLPKADLVSFEVRNVAGVLLFSKTSMLQAGRNKFILNNENVNFADHGILIYTISTSTDRISKRMVAIQ